MNIGIPETTLGQQYTWLKDGKAVKGPIDGNGGSQSYQFTLSSPSEAGTYKIITTKEGCSPAYFGNVVVNFAGPLPQTIFAEPVCGTSLTSVRLAGSQVGFNYQLREDGYNAGGSVAGTGSEISFVMASSYASTYTVVASGNGASNVEVARKDNSGWTGPPYVTGFNTSLYTLPNCWTQQSVTGTSLVESPTSTVTPVTAPFEGSRFVWWNSNAIPAGHQTRLASPNIYNNLYASLDVEFYWYHNNNAAKNSGNYLNEGVQVQLYTGTAWIDVGSFIPRHNGSLPANTGGWTKKIITIGSVGIQEPIRIGLKFRSEGGDNCSIDQFQIVKTPLSQCATPAVLYLPSISATTGIVSWLRTSSTATYQYKVQAEGHPYPESAINITDTTVSLTGLQPGKQYSFYVRAKCGNDSSQWISKTFVTLPDCSNAPSISLCTPVTASFSAGNGAWNFNGNYPVNSSGIPFENETPGRELIYRFTPPSTGVYYIKVTSPASYPISYLFRPAAEGCCSGNWTGIKFYNNNGDQSRAAIGMLQGGVTYLLVLDNTNAYVATNETFKICKATVGLLTTDNGYGNQVALHDLPANNPKEEHFIDSTGNLLASIDMTSSNSPIYSIYISNYINTGAIRRDNSSKEYLNRKLYIDGLNDSVKVKFYFTNSELQKLIDEPNDGIADVSSIFDLKVTVADGFEQPDGDQMTSLILPLSNGSYDDTSRYIYFKTNESRNYFLHGGAEALFYSRIICPGGTTTFKVRNYFSSGYTYQWQVDNGTGFADLANNTIYSGATTFELLLTNPPTSYYGYKYRCKIFYFGIPHSTSGFKMLKLSSLWTGTTSTAWSTAGNWGCNRVPDANTDVVIPLTTNKPVVSNNTSCRSIILKTGTILRITPGVQLTVIGK